MNVKKKLLTKACALILSLFIAVATLEIGGINSFAEGTHATIYASDILNNKTSKYYTYEDNWLTLNLTDDVDLVMDTDLVVDYITCQQVPTEQESQMNNTLTIKGNKKLTINDGATIIYNYIQDSGAEVIVKNGLFDVWKTANIKSGANLTVDYSGGNHHDYALFVVGDLSSAGNVKVTTVGCGVYSCGSLNISGGELNVNAGDAGVGAIGGINISGGNVYSSAAYYGLVSDKDITISGGYVESHISATSQEALCVRGINISTVDPMYIKTPANAKIGSVDITYDVDNNNGVLDESGNRALDVIFGNKELEAQQAAEEAKAAEEAAAKKAAEEVAAKKAAEEAAAKKAAEEAAAKKTSEESSSNASEDASSSAVNYSNEWVNGQWYGSNGDTSYTAQGSWKANSSGWWFEDTAGWYPQNQWVKIDGKWYYFLDSGYMDYSEYRDGYWLGSDGAWVEGYQNGTWHVDSTGWWFEDNGWYPSNQYLWINGSKYWFNSKGYME